MHIQAHPIYSQYFPEHGDSPQDWSGFKDYQALRTDYSTSDITIRSKENSWSETAKKVAHFLLKIIIFPWGLYELARSLFERIAMLFIYPAQLIPQGAITSLRAAIELNFNSPTNANKIIREVVLEKDGVKYNGLMIGNKDRISNGKWAILSGGNAVPLESLLFNKQTDPIFWAGYNCLLINGPGAGRSQGTATVDRLGDAQEAGITFLETAIRAQRIVLAGHSLGGAAIGLAALKHTFKPEVSYLAIRMMTFDRLTNIASKLMGRVAAAALWFFGCEIDSVAASRKLQEAGVHEVIIEGGQDTLMRSVGLLEALENADLMENKSGFINPEAGHNDLSNDQIKDQVLAWDVLQDQQPVAFETSSGVHLRKA